MKKLEIILGTVAVASVMMRFMLVPTSGTIMTVVLLLLAMFYYVKFGFSSMIGNNNLIKNLLSKTPEAKRKLTSMFYGTALAIAIIGIWQKLMFFPSASIILLVGSVLLVLGLILAIYINSKNPNDYYGEMLKRVAVIGGFALMLYVTPTNGLVDIIYRNKPGYATTLKKVLENPGDKQLQEELMKKTQELSD